MGLQTIFSFFTLSLRHAAVYNLTPTPLSLSRGKPLKPSLTWLVLNAAAYSTSSG